MLGNHGACLAPELGQHRLASQHGRDWCRRPGPGRASTRRAVIHRYYRDRLDAAELMIEQRKEILR